MSRTNRILVHWPDRRLSGNSTANRWKRTEAKDIARALTKNMLMETNFFIPSGKLAQRVVFFPPDLRKRDDDNWYIALKAVRDTIFKEFKRDDTDVRLTIIEWGTVCKGGRVGLEFTSLEDYEKENVQAWIGEVK